MSEVPPRTLAWGSFFNHGVFADYLAAASPQEQSSVNIHPELDADFRLTADSDDFLKFGGASVEADLPEGTVDLDGRAVPRAAPSLGAHQWAE